MKNNYSGIVVRYRLKTVAVCLGMLVTASFLCGTESPADAPIVTVEQRTQEQVQQLLQGAAKVGYDTDTETLSTIARFAVLHGDSHGIPPAVIMAIIRKESTFDPRCVGSSGELGLMQVMPATARSVCKEHGLLYTRDRMFNPDFNILVGTLYLKEQMHRYGDLSRAFVAYNAGRGYCRSNAYSRGVFGHLQHFAR